MRRARRKPDLGAPGTHWIRNAQWDGFWILSGFPIGLALVGLSALWPAHAIQFSLLVALQAGHLFAPMAIAWSHSGFRPVMLKEKGRYISVPVIILLLCAVVGLAFGSRLVTLGAGSGPDGIPGLGGPGAAFSPFTLLVWTYAAWNTYHFAAQNFGVLSIYRHKEGGFRPVQRRLDQAFCYAHILTTVPIAMGLARFLGIQTPSGFASLRNGYILAAILVTGGMIVLEMRNRSPSIPRILFILTIGLGSALTFWQGLIGFAIYTLNHWMVSIGLSALVFSVDGARAPERERWHRSFGVFALALVAASAAYFALAFVSVQVGSGHIAHFAVRATGLAVGSRLGLGFVHFLYDRYVYRLGNPQVRATIGRDLITPVRAAG